MTLLPRYVLIRRPAPSVPSMHAAVGGKWAHARAQITLPDPMNGEPFLKAPDTQPDEIQPFVHSLKSVPKHGLHNPLKNPER